MNNKKHGKSTLYFDDGRICNYVYRNGSQIAEKFDITQDEAYYSKTGAPIKANDPNWKSFTELLNY